MWSKEILEKSIEELIEYRDSVIVGNTRLLAENSRLKSSNEKERAKLVVLQDALKNTQRELEETEALIFREKKTHTDLVEEVGKQNKVLDERRASILTNTKKANDRE